MSVPQIRSIDRIYKAVVKKEDAYSRLSEFVEIIQSFNAGESNIDAVQEYLRLSRGCQEILDLIRDLANSSAKDAGTLINVSSNILVRIANDLKHYCAVGSSFVAEILGSGCKTLYNFLRSNQKPMRMQLTLHLLSAMVAQGPQAARDVFVKMGFSNNSFPHLLNKCNQTKDDDVRTSYLNLIVLFLNIGDNSLVRQILETKGFLNGIFPGIAHDRPSAIILILETFLTKIINNPSIAKTSKVRLFNDFTLKFVLVLYDWKGTAVRQQKPLKRKLGDRGEFPILEESEETILSVHESAHKFLLEVCCSHKNGIVFRDTTGGSSGKNQNHIITNILKSLTNPHLHSLKTAFLISVLKTCPGQTKYYLPSLSDSFSPRLSVPWMKAIEMLIKIIDAQNHLSMLFEVGEKVAISKMVATAKEIIFPEIISISHFDKCLKDDHPFVCCYLLKYLCCSLQCVRQIGRYSDTPSKNSLYSSTELKGFYSSFLPVVEKAVPSFTVIQEYWYRLANTGNAELEEDVSHWSTTEEIEMPTFKMQLSQILEVFKSYRDVFSTIKISDDFCQNVFSGLRKIQEETSDIKDYSLQLELLDFIGASNSNEMNINVQNVTFSPIHISLDIYLSVEDIQSKSRVAHAILQLLSNIYSLHIDDWELNIWLKYLKSENNLGQTALVTFFGEVLKIAAKQDHTSVGIGEDNKQQGCSDLLFAAQFCLNPDHENAKTCVGYVESVLRVLMHRQVEPEKLLSDTEKHHHAFSDSTVNYWRMISDFKKYKTQGKNISQYLIKHSTTCSDALQNVFVSINFGSEKASLNEMSRFAQLLAEIQSRDFVEIENLLLQLLTYIRLEAAIVLEASFNDKETNIAFYVSTIEDLIGKIDPTEELLTANGKMSYKHYIMETILQHPVTSKYFLFLPNNDVKEQDYKAILMLSHLVFPMLSVYIENNDSFSSSNVFIAFKEKAIIFCKAYITVLYRDSTYSTSLWDIVKKLITNFSSMFSCQDVVSVLEKFLSLEDEHFQVLDSKLRMLSTLVDMYCESDEYCLLSSQCARVLLCKYLSHKRKKQAIVVKLLKKHPLYATVLEQGDIDQLLTQRSLSGLELLDLLVFHNVEIRNNVRDFIISILGSVEEENEEFFLMLVTMVAKDISSYKKRKNAAFLTSVVEDYWKCFCNIILRNIGQNITHSIASVGHVISTLQAHNLIGDDKVKEALNILLQASEHSIPAYSKLNILLEIIPRWKTSWPPASLLKLIISWMTLSFQVGESGCLDEALVKFSLDCVNNIDKKVIQKHFKDISEWRCFVQATLKTVFRNGNCGASVLDLLMCICKQLSESEKVKASTKEEIEIVYTFLTSHSNFFQVMMNESNQNEQLKGSILSLLIILVKANTSFCKDTHIPLLLASYTGSLSCNDQKVLYLLRLYESAGIIMENFSPFMWGNSAIAHYSVNKDMKYSLWKQPKMREILSLFQKDLLYSLVLNFPLDLKLQVEIYENKDLNSQHYKMYDPRFVLHLASVLLSPGAYVKCREFIESGVLGVTFRSLSSEDKDMRGLGYYCLSQLYSHLQSAMSKQCQVWIALLDSIRYSIEKPNPRIPSIVTLFLAKAVSILIKPDNQLYSSIYKFLTVKPTLDLMRVPEFYKLFNSTDIEYRLQRSWILSLVAEGLQTSLDFHLCQKIYLFTILLPFYSSPISVESEKVKILQIILASVKIFSSARSLCQTGLLAWLFSVISNSETQESTIINALNDIMYTLWQTSRKNTVTESQSLSDGDDLNLPSASSSKEVDEEKTPKGKLMYSSFPSEFLLTHFGLIGKLGLLNDAGLLKYLQTLLNVLNSNYIKKECLENSFVDTRCPLTFNHVCLLIKYWQGFSDSQLIGKDHNDTIAMNSENVRLVHQHFCEILMFWTPPWTQLTFEKHYDTIISSCIDISYFTFQHLLGYASCIDSFSQWLLKCLNSDRQHGLRDSLCSSNTKSIYCTHAILRLSENASAICVGKQKDKFSVWSDICSQLICSEYVSHQLTVIQSLLKNKS